MAHSYTRGHLNHHTPMAGIKKKISGSLFALLWMLAPGLIKKVIYQQFFTPQRINPTPEQAQILATGESFEIMAKDDPIQCWKWGSGPYILCVHGWNGNGSHFYKMISTVVETGCSMIVFDGPAHGISPGKTCSYFQMTDVVRTFLRHDAYDISGLIGHSFGAGAVINGLDKENIRLPAILIAPALEFNRIIDNAFAQYGVSKKIYMALIRQFEDQYGYSFRGDDPVKLLDHTDLNLMVIHDKADTTFDYDTVKEIIDRYPAFRWLGTDGLGHKRILRDKQVIDKSLDFIRLHHE